MGKTIWESSIETRLGEEFQLGMFLRTLWKRTILICICGRHQIDWQETNKTKNESFSWKTSIWENQHHFLTLYIRVTLKENTKRAKILLLITEPCLNPKFQQEATEKLSSSESFSISTWSSDMEAHVQKCVERYCELTNKSTQQHYKESTPCIDDHHFKEEELKSVGELSKYMLSSCCEILILDTYWTTWYSMLWEQTCTIDYKMDQSLRQTPESIDILHSSHMWIQNILSCGKNTVK